MSILLNVSGLPAASILAGGVSGTAGLDFCFRIDGNASESDAKIPLFNLTCMARIAGGASVNSTSGPIAVVGKLSSLTGCAVSEKWSSVGVLGPAILSILENAVDALFKVVLIPLANVHLEKGTPIPMIELKDPKSGKAVDIHIVNGKIDEEPGFGLIQADANATVVDTTNSVAVWHRGTSPPRESGAATYV